MALTLEQGGLRSVDPRWHGFRKAALWAEICLLLRRHRAVADRGDARCALREAGPNARGIQTIRGVALNRWLRNCAALVKGVSFTAVVAILGLASKCQTPALRFFLGRLDRIDLVILLPIQPSFLCLPHSPSFFASTWIEQRRGWLIRTDGSQPELARAQNPHHIGKGYIRNMSWPLDLLACFRRSRCFGGLGFRLHGNLLLWYRFYPFFSRLCGHR